MPEDPSILVTGASGLLGRALVKRLSVKNRVTGISRSGAEGTRVCDLTREADVHDLFQNETFRWAVHTAAISDVDGCEREPAVAHAANGLATRHLAENCAIKNVPFIYISTDYVFDGKRRSPYPENAKTCPVNVYGLTKLEGEVWSRRVSPICAIVRTSWLFGSGQPRNFVNAIVERMKTQNRVPVLADQEDSPTYVEDLAVCLEKIGTFLEKTVQKKRESKFQAIFQIHNAGSTTRYGMALAIRKILGLKNVEVEKLNRSQIPDRLALRPPYAVMSTRLFETFFKMRMRHWEEALKDYLLGAAS